MPEILLNKESFEEMNAQFEKVFAEALDGARSATKAERALSNPNIRLCDLQTAILSQESEDIRYVMRNIITSFTATDQELAKKAQEIGSQYVGPNLAVIINQIGKSIGESIKKILARSDEYKEVANQLKEKDVEYKVAKPYKKQPSEKKIIKNLGGYDNTGGSCASQAFAYIANKAGYNVRDYRGGDSKEIFSYDSNIIKIASMPGVESKIIYGKNDIQCANELLKDVQPGKEYYLRTGSHAAIVRKNGDKYQYLELQSAKSNGWKDLSDDVLVNRFAATPERAEERNNVLIDTESMYDNPEFISIVGYLNTK